MEFVEEEDKVEKKKITQLLLNTSGFCFLCLQDNKGEGVGSDGDFNAGIIDLSNVCRYLNIDQCALLLTSLKNDGGEGVEDLEHNLCTFSVNLCLKCLELTEKLNDVIIELERAKLMVNYHLHSFHKILEGKNEKEESGQSIDLQKKVTTNLDNSLDAKLVQLLREEAKDKSLKILKKAEAAKPQVILSKLTPPQPSPPPPPSPPPIIPSTFFGTSPSVKTLLSQLTTSNQIFNKSRSKSKLYRCPYCTKIMTHSKFALHLCCLHPDKLLSSYFPPPSLPPSESLCRQVLQSQVISKAQKLASTNPSLPRLGCHLCGITYGEGTLLKHHFLISHTDKLCEYITQFQSTPQESKSLKMSSKSSSLSQSSQSVNHLIKNLLDTSLINPTNQFDKANKRRYQCPFCELSPVYSKFPIHLANLHPDKLLESVTPSIDKRKGDNPNYFSQLCGKVLAKQVAMATKSLVSTTRGGGGTKSSKLCCHLCASRYSDGRHLRHHLIVCHTDHLCEELIKMGNVKVVEDKVQDKQKKKVKEKAKLKRKRMTRSSEDRTCKICRQTFAQYDKLQRHLVSVHPEQLFLECKPGGMEDKQWQGICKGILKREVRGATYGKPGNKIYKCAYCLDGRKKSFKGRGYLEVHLAYQHGEIMGKKLRYGEDRVEGVKHEEEEDGGGDQVVVEEEDGSEFDVKPDIGEMDEMMYGDIVSDELNDKEDEMSDNLDPLQQLYGDFEEIAGGDSGTIKMEVNETLIPDDY